MTTQNLSWEQVAAAHLAWRQAGSGDLSAWCARYPAFAEQLRAVAAGYPAAAGGEVPPFLAPAQAADEIGRFGPYRVLGVLGQGGMGTVLLAEDRVLQRKIALKVMPSDMARDAEARQRFLREAQATAALDHEHIIAIYQVGEIAGLPFIAMPVLQGETLDARLRRSPPVLLTEAVRIAREMALGLACAHAAGVVHRDIKPANVFLRAPTGQVKLLDFGLARSVVGDQKLTKSGLILGTPAYMAPEQADTNQPIDHRCDLFSLGIVLYRMLTGVQPFESPTLMGTLSKLLMRNPAHVLQLNPQVPPPLANLTMALMAKAPTERPPTAQVVADALAGVLGTAPTVVMPAADVWANLEETVPAVPTPLPVPALPTPPRRSPWVSRVGVLGALALLLVVGAVGLWWTMATGILSVEGGTVQVLRNGTICAEVGDTQSQALPVGTYELASAAGELSVTSVRLGRGQRITVRVTPPIPAIPPPVPVVVAPPSEPLPPPSDLLPAWVSGFKLLNSMKASDIPLTERAWIPSNTIAICGVLNLKHYSTVRNLAFTPDGQRLFGSALGDRVRVWETDTGRMRSSFSLPRSSVNYMALSPDGKLSAVCGPISTVTLFDSETRQEVLQTEGLDKGTTALAFSPDGQWLAVGGISSKLQVVNVKTGKIAHTFTGHEGALTAVTFAPQGRWLASAGADACARVYDLPKGKLLATLKGHDAPITALAFTPDGSVLVTASEDSTIRSWAVNTAQCTHTAAGHDGAVLALAFHPTLPRLASAGRDKTIRLWDTQNRQPLGLLTGHFWDVTALAFSPDGKLLASGSGDSTIRLWDWAARREVLVPPGHRAQVLCAVLTPDARRVISGSSDRTVRIWDTLTGQEQQVLTAHTQPVTTAAVRFDGTVFVTGGDDQAIFLWATSDGKLLKKWQLASGRITTLLFKDASNQFLAGTYDGKIRSFDSLTRQEGHEWPAHSKFIRSLAVTPDGRRVLSAGDDGTVKLWTLPNLAPTWTVTAPTNQSPVAVQFSLDAKEAWVIYSDGTITAYDVATATIKTTVLTRATRVGGIRFSPEGKFVLVWAGGNGHFFSLATRERLGASGSSHSAAVSLYPDGRHVVLANPNGTVMILRLSDPQSLLPK
jgi:WD40 repeat protein/serine/threonine protein kinase